MDRKYFFLLTKRAIRLCPVILALSLLIMATVSAAAALIISGNEESSAQKISVGIVGDIESTYLGIGMYALENMDNSRFYVDFLILEDEDEAARMLDRGELDGIVEVPDGFVSALIDGDAIPIRYVVRNAPAGLGTILGREVGDIAADLVTETQKGLYGMQRYARQIGKADGELWKKVDAMNLKYLKFILDRGELYEIHITGVADEVGFGAYYVCAALMFLLLLWGISCFGLLKKKDLSLQKLLFAHQKGALRPYFWEYAVFFLFTCLFYGILFVIFALAGGALPIPELEFFDPLGFLLACLPVLLAITALQSLLYELIPDTVGVILVQFVAALFLGYVSGCFYPAWFFPESVQNFASVLPAGAGLTVMRSALGEVYAGRETLICLGWFALFLIAGMAVRKHRLKR